MVMCSKFCTTPKCDIDYYGVLGLTKDCTELDIKKAFRRLAIQYNPERRKNEDILEIFTLIAEAYEVLSDPLRRCIYDQYGEVGLKRGVPTPNGHISPYVFHGDPMQTYHQFFGTKSPYADLLNILADTEALTRLAKGQEVKVKDKPLVMPLELTLQEIFFGGVKKVKMERRIFVDTEETCTKMGEKIFTILIKPGLPTDTEIVFPEAGDQGPSRIPADVVFVTKERPHKVFHRENDNLLMNADVSLKEALTGTVIKIDTLDDRTLRIPVTSVITPEYHKVVAGEGLPKLEDSTCRGDLMINFNIQFPLYLSVTSKNHVKEAFDVAEAKVIPDCT